MVDRKNAEYARLKIDPDPPLPELDIDARRHMYRHFLFKDHAVVRAIWSNQARIGPGVIRSSQPSPEKIRNLKNRGLRTIINLRGANPNNSFYYLENRTCQDLNVNLVSIDFYPRGSLPPVANILKFYDVIENSEGNVLFHCKSGADRTGLAAALYVLMFKGIDFSLARSQLSPRFLHIKSRKMGVFDHVIDAYEIAYKKNGLPIMDWIKDGYNPAELMRTYRKKIGLID